MRALELLVQHDRRYPSDQVAEHAWPDGLPPYAEVNPRAALSSAISDFRGRLRRAGPPFDELAERVSCVLGDWWYDRHDTAISRVDETAM
jgi:hypothetical protein